MLWKWIRNLLNEHMKLRKQSDKAFKVINHLLDIVGVTKVENL
jgi:hypothetical protein